MAVKAKSKRKASRSKRRADKPVNYWHHTAAPVLLGEDRFEVEIVNRLGGNPRPIGDLTTAFSWDDAEAELSGSVSVTATDTDALTVRQNDRVNVKWSRREGSPFAHLWTMKSSSPERTRAGDLLALTLSTTLTEARKSRESFRFKPDHAHPHGWTADQIAVDVCKRVGIRVGKIAKATHLIRNLVQTDADPIDVIVKAYRSERVATGNRFFMRWDGTLNIEPLRRPEHLLELSGALIDAAYKVELPSDFATSLTVRATAKMGDKHHGVTTKKHKRTREKIHVRVSSPSGIKTFGYVHRTVDAKDADTEAEARTYGERMLAKVMKPKQTLTVTVPIMPTLRRGDAFQVLWKSQGLTQIVFVSSVQHSVSPGASTSQITATFDDPYVDSRADKDAAKRAAAAAKRKRKRGDTAPAAATSSRSRRRAN